MESDSHNIWYKYLWFGAHIFFNSFVDFKLDDQIYYNKIGNVQNTLLLLVGYKTSRNVWNLEFLGSNNRIIHKKIYLNGNLVANKY